MIRIQFDCEHCNHSLSVPQEHAGKRAKCPRCGKPTFIPLVIVEEVDEIAEVEVEEVEEKPARAPAWENKAKVAPSPRPREPECPSCGAFMGEKAVICIQCGLDLRTGNKLVTQGVKQKALPASSKLKGVSASARRWYDLKIAREPARVLRCRKCKQEFWINNDSSITTGHELLKNLEKGGSRILNVPGRAILERDAVLHTAFEGLPEKAAGVLRQANRDRLEEAANDPSREWNCLCCGKTNEYGEPLPWSFDVCIDDLLDVQVAVFEALLHEELGRRVGYGPDDFAAGDIEAGMPIYLAYQQYDPATCVRDRLAKYGDIRSLMVPKTGDEIFLEVKNVVAISRHVMTATGACNNGAFKYRVTRGDDEWDARETRSLYESYRLYGWVKEMYEKYGAAFFEIYGAEIK